MNTADGVPVVLAPEHRVRHRLSNMHVRDLRDDVVQAFDVLDVDGGKDIDAEIQEFEHVLPSFFVP